jgi:hypothetical protein|nr:hypothetical protein [uncultured Flavobacterium sp.]
MSAIVWVIYTNKLFTLPLTIVVGSELTNETSLEHLNFLNSDDVLGKKFQLLLAHNYKDQLLKKEVLSNNIS